MNEYFKIFFFSLIFIIIIKKSDKCYYNKIKLMKNNLPKKRIIYDVLFVNGCDPNILPHPYRYRVLNQIEQLNSGFLASVDIFYLRLNPLISLDFRVIIFYRCPWTEDVEKTIILAKSLNKKVLFDIDDLVIDKKYTDLIPYVQSLLGEEKKIYNDGVSRMRKTLKLCDGAITTTEILSKELKNYVSEVFINRNVASEEMFKLSEYAIKNKIKKKNINETIIGYFSGSITHNEDLKMIIPVFIKILQEFKFVKLFLMGEIDIPDELKQYSSQIIKKPFVDWKKLPELISKVDINIAPIKKTIFNEAKSENKWLEAALVKVPTVASNFGAFKKIIINGETGLLCTNNEDWYNSLKSLILNKNLQKSIAKKAFEVVKKKYNTLETSFRLSNYINSITNKHIGFVLPSLQISGGIRVVLMHASFLQDEGWDVDLLVPQTNIYIFEYQGHKFNVIGLNKALIYAKYDILVATLHSTLSIILKNYKVKRRLYLVQNYETDFYQYGEFLRMAAEKTYFGSFGVEYITISKWCESWLWEKYKQKSRYAPNGINLESFIEHKRNLNKSKIRILIEGDNSSHYKNVDESFKIVERIDKNKFEVWYMSYNAKPKKWYRVDKFLNKVPFEKVSEVYEKCDILIKSSWLESFSYPPLEMMATGGYCIVVPNGGNLEYLKDKENCLFYKQGDIDEAVHCIEKLISDENLQQYLYENGLATAKKRNWKKYKEQILSLYKERQS